MSIHTQVAELVAARNLVNKGLAPILEQLKDQSIPLEDRWAAYTALVENDVLVQDDGYGDGFIDELGNNLTLFDDFYMERHESRTFIEMYDIVMEAEGDYQAALVEAKNNLPQWQEKVLASGYASFTYDW